MTATSSSSTTDTTKSTFTSVVDHFWTHVETRPTSPALYVMKAGEWRGIDWKTFGGAVEKLGCFLMKHGVTEQTHVGIWSGNRPEWHIADMAVLSVRGRPAPVYQTFSASQAAYVLSHCEAKVVICETDKVADKVLQEKDKLPLLERIIVIESSDQLATRDPRIIGWEAALAEGDSLRSALGNDFRKRRDHVLPTDVVTLIYTSGTTGPPKAVMLTHSNIMAAVDALKGIFEAGPDDRMISYLPLAHIAERLASEFRSYFYGSPTYFVQNLTELPAALRSVRPTIFFGVPRVWEKFASRIQSTLQEQTGIKGMISSWALKKGTSSSLADKLVLSKVRAQLGMDAVRICVSGAAPMNPDVVSFFGKIGLEICDIYGQSEDTALTTMNFPGKVRPGTVGQPLVGNEIKIADDSEILIKGGVVFHGYYKDEAATKEALHAGWLHTGDLGSVDKDGYLTITGRKKDLIITAGGKNISPSNIEMALESQPLIAHAVVIGDRRPFVSALIALDPDALSAWATKHHVVNADAARKDQRVTDEIGKHVASVNGNLSPTESVRQYRIVDRDFAVGEELTPTMKVKRRVVDENFASVIDEIYSAKGAAKAS